MNPFAALMEPLRCRPGDVIEDIPLSLEPRLMRGGPAHRSTRPTPAVDNPWGLTPAQCEVMRLIIMGKSHLQVATVMGRSDRSIEDDLRRIRKKMRALNTIAACIVWDRHFRARV